MVKPLVINLFRISCRVALFLASFSFLADHCLVRVGYLVLIHRVDALSGSIYECGIHLSHAEQFGFDLRGEDGIVRSFRGSSLIGKRHAQVENERRSAPRADDREAAAARYHKRLPGRDARLVRVAVLEVDHDERVADRAIAMSIGLELGLGRIKQLKRTASGFRGLRVQALRTQAVHEQQFPYRKSHPE